MINEMILENRASWSRHLRISRSVTSPFMVFLKVIQDMVPVLSNTVATGC